MSSDVISAQVAATTGTVAQDMATRERRGGGRGVPPGDPRQPPKYGEAMVRRSDFLGPASGAKPAPAAAPAPSLLNEAAMKGSAASAAQRQRRRAAAGHSGKVTTGTPTLLQQQVAASLIPKTLIGS